MDNLKNYVWQNKIIPEGFYIKIDSNIKRNYILGIESIKFEAEKGVLRVCKNEEINFTNLFLTLVILGSEELMIDKKTFEEPNLKNPIDLFKLIQREEILNRNIKIDEYNYNYMKNSTFYLISPYYDDSFYINREIEKDLWK
jgi:hypothetical protein